MYMYIFTYLQVFFLDSQGILLKFGIAVWLTLKSVAKENLESNLYIGKKMANSWEN